jgi:PIN domain nuclease of toxin-antitoxin system
VVVWEVAIKRSWGKLDAPTGLAPALLAAGAQPLPPTLDHAAAVETLPWRIRDPFDRLLIAHAQTDALTIVSQDESLVRYGVPLVW